MEIGKRKKEGKKSFFSSNFSFFPFSLFSLLVDKIFVRNFGRGRQFLEELR